MRSPALCTFVLLASWASAQVTVDLAPNADNTLYQDAAGGLSNGAGTRLFVGVTGQNRDTRAVLHFDVAAAVPAGATILSAELQLSEEMAASNLPVTVSMHLLSQAFGEGASRAARGGGGGAPAEVGDATWLHAVNPGVLWNSPGGDFAAAASASLSMGGVTGPNHTFTGLAADVQAFLDQPATNYGWLLQAQFLGFATARAFTSREGNAFTAPRLRIVYGTASVQAASIACGTLNAAGRGRPSLGNLGFGLDFTGTPGATVWTFLAAAPAPGSLALPGGCFVDLELTSGLALVQAGASPLPPVVLDAAGMGFLPAPIPSDPALDGLSVTAQGLVAGATYETSEALVVTLGS